MNSTKKCNDPLFHYETHFPESFQRLSIENNKDNTCKFRGSRRLRRQDGFRYKTQPITFDEITEIDEEAISLMNETDLADERVSINRCMHISKAACNFEPFSRSIDGLMSRMPEQLPRFSVNTTPIKKHLERNPSIHSIPERTESDTQGIVSPASAHWAEGTAVREGISEHSCSLPLGSPSLISESERMQQENQSTDSNTVSTTCNTGVIISNRVKFKHILNKSSECAKYCDESSPETIDVERDASENRVDLGTCNSSVPRAELLNIVPRRQKLTAKAKKRQRKACN